MNQFKIFNTAILGILLVNVQYFCHGENILFFMGGGGYSHKASSWPWVVELAKRNHQVTFISGIDKRPSDHPNIHDITPTGLSKIMSQTYGIERFTQREEKMKNTIIFDYSAISVKTCEVFMESLNSDSDPKLGNLLNSKFDLIVANAIFGECGFLLGFKFQAKVIVYDPTISLGWFHDVFGFSHESSWVPDLSLNIEHDESHLSFRDRFSNTFWPLYWYWDRYNNLYPKLEDLYFKRFHPNVTPSVAEIEKNVSLVMMNSHPSIDFPIPLPAGFIQIGGLALKEGNDTLLPKIYKDFMEASGSSGVVLISFGSTVDLEKVPKHYSDIFFNIIKRNKDVRFLMKWKGTLPTGFQDLDNLLASDWLPQKDILRHPKLKAFLTHGGLNSIQEATFYGVPLIVSPLFADQDYNAFRVQAQNVGVRLEISGLTEEHMQSALDKVLNDPKYKSNMQAKSKIFRDRPLHPLDAAVYWTEFVLRHNDTFNTLMPQNSHLSWYQKRLLDIYAVCFAICFILPMILLYFVRKIILWSLSSKPKAMKIIITKKKN